jgi:hypothetical protein
MTLAEPVLIARKIAAIFDALKIRYAIGGSLASSLYGIPRATQDVDIIAAIDEPGQAAALTNALRTGFYIDEDAVRLSLASGSAFNAIDLETLLKIDIFPLQSSPETLQELSRRRQYDIGDTAGQALFLCSPEDIIIQKLKWFRSGNEVSERQWNDALGVVRVQSNALDYEYLREMARTMQLTDLLDRLMAEE